MSAGRPGFRLLAITPPHGAVDEGLVEAWAPARAVGLAVLLRDPGASPAALVEPSHRLTPLRLACERAGIPCLLSVDAGAREDLEPALGAAGIVGVQLRGDPSEAAVAAARSVLGPRRRLGRSCHGTPRSGGPEVDYSVLAPIFTPQTGPSGDRPPKVAVGLEPLRAFAAREPHVFALGGITGQTAPACLQAGAWGLAAIRSFFGPRREVVDNVGRWVRAMTEPAHDAASTP
ncbi:MAG: thiamine phosphate synthase [Myxococcota bacterium]